MEERYDMRAAAAYVLGHARAAGVPALPSHFDGCLVDDCDENDWAELVSLGAEAGIRLYPFKRTTQILPRVKRTMGFLHSISLETLLDVGSGRGVFLIPFVEEFPCVQVTALDLLEKRTKFLNELAAGGFGTIHAEISDVCTQPYPEDSFDVVTLLEVLEHIPDVEKAIQAAVCMAKQYVVLSVPSKPDNNPEHIHLLTKEKLTRMFGDAGCTRLHFDGVEGHLFMTATIR